MRDSPKYTFQFDSDLNPNSNNSESNTSCIELNTIPNHETLTIDNIKRKVRIIQNFIEADLSELSLHTSKYNKPNEFIANQSISYNNANWSKINEIRTKIESNIQKGTNFLNSVKFNTSTDNIQIVRYMDIFNQYQKDLNTIMSNVESKQPKNLLLFDDPPITDSSQPTDRSILTIKQNNMLRTSLFDIESLTEEALSTLHKSQESNERFQRIRSKMYSVLNTHLPNVDMVHKNILHIATKNQLIIAVTIAICIFLLLIAIFK